MANCWKSWIPPSMSTVIFSTWRTMTQPPWQTVIIFLHPHESMFSQSDSIFRLIALVRSVLHKGPSPGGFVDFDSLWKLVGLSRVVRLCWVLTISAHAGSNALLETAVLAPVPVHPLDRALLVLRAWSVLDLLLDWPPEESLQSCALETREVSWGIRTVVRW